MRVTVLTLGCRVNQSESSVIEASLQQNGINIVDLKDNPDYCIINTCTVTSSSDHNSRQLIRKAARSGAKVVVTGCYSQLNAVEVKGIQGVAHVVENKNKFDIINLLSGSLSDPSYGRYSRARPILKVQDGCNFHCSYCTVPLARGRSTSIQMSSVIERIKEIEAGGYNEVVLTGVHLGTFGHDLQDNSSLKLLLRNILLHTTIARIRLSSLEVNEICEEIIDLLQEQRVCSHLHIPLQSGSDRILGLMRRNYSADHYRKKVYQVASKIDNIAIGTDVIIGFPGEDKSDFDSTRYLCDDLPFSYLHAFPYSDRLNTESVYFNDKVPNEVIRQRMAIMKKLANKKKIDYMSSQVGRVIDVIMEKMSNHLVSGTSGNYLKVVMDSDTFIKGSIVYVRPTVFLGDKLLGVVEKNS